MTLTAQAELSKTYGNWAIVVDEQELRRLVDECRQALDDKELADVEVAVQVLFSDGLSLTTSSLDELLGEENPRRRSIKGLRLEALTRSRKIVCAVGAQQQLRGERSWISVSGSERQWVYVTFSRIEDRLRRMKQWHPRGVMCGWVAALVAFVTGVVIYRAVDGRNPGLLNTPAPIGGGAVPTGLGFIAGLLVLGVVVLAGSIVFRLFPDPVFRIGDGVTRHDRIKSGRAKLGWAILAAGILTPLVRALSGLIW